MTHPAKALISKAFPIVVTKTLDDQGIVEAIVSVFGVLDDGDDIVHPGAFTKTLAERGYRVRVLDQHRTGSILDVLGKPLEMREVSKAELPQEVLMRFPEATGGLFTRTQYNLETINGREAFARIKAGDIQEYSFAYEALDFDYGELNIDGRKRRVRHLRTLRLWEFSPVIWGMNPATATVGAKASQKGYAVQLGNYIHGKMVAKLSRCLTDLYQSGYMSTEDFNTTLSSGIQHLSEFEAGLPDSVRLAEVDESYMYYMSNEGRPEPKAETPSPEPKESDVEATSKAGPDAPPTLDEQKAILEERKARLLAELQSTDIPKEE